MPPAIYPPTGPGPLRPAEARRAVEEAIAAARERDRQLREEIARLAGDRVAVADAVAAAHAEVGDARSLASRALVQADEAAQAGQRADAAARTAVARVFAMRWRDSRARAEAGERQLAAIDEARRRAEAGLAANAGALDAAAAAHLASLSGRRAARLQAEVDATVAEVDASAAELVLQAEAAARAEPGSGASPLTAGEAAPVDDLEDEVDLESVDPLLDELRGELGLGGPTPAPGEAAEAAAAPEAGAAGRGSAGADAGPTAAGAGPTSGAGRASRRGRIGASPESRGRARARR